MSDVKITDEENKKAAQQVDEIRKLVEEAGGSIENLKGEAKSRYEKIDADLKAYDAKVEEINKQLAEEKIAKIDLEEKVNNLEKVISRQSENSKTKEDYKLTPQYKALQTYIRKGKLELCEEEKQLLSTDDNSRGGYLVGAPMVQEILKEVAELSPIRQEARVRSIGNTKAIQIPVRTSIPLARYEGEREAADEQTQTYRSETMVAHRHHVIVPVTRDLLNFADVNMESEMQTDASEGFAVSEGILFLTGTGDKQPEGILVNPNIATTTSATSGVVTVTEAIQLFGELKVGYNPVYFFNRKTLVDFRTQRDESGGAGTGGYLWQVGAENQPATLNGIPYRIFPAMPDIAANAKAVGLGDLARGYTIFDSTTIEIVRDDLTKADEAIIKMHWYRYNTGQVTIPEAIKLIKVKA